MACEKPPELIIDIIPTRRHGSEAKIILQGLGGYFKSSLGCRLFGILYRVKGFGLRELEVEGSLYFSSNNIQN